MKKSRVLVSTLGLLPLLWLSPWVGADTPTSSPPATTESQPSPATTPENPNARASSTAKAATPDAQPIPQPKAPGAHPKPPATPKTALEEFLGPMLPILAGAEKLEGYIVAPELADASVPEKSKLAGYAVLKGPVIPTETQVKTVQALLLDEKSYFWGLAKKCLLHPDAALRFLKERNNHLGGILPCFTKANSTLI